MFVNKRNSVNQQDKTYFTSIFHQSEPEFEEIPGHINSINSSVFLKGLC